MNKQEIARQQIHGAIRVYFLGGDPIVIASLAAPASQILRDMNKNNPRAISNALTEIAKEHNVPPSQLWSKFNDNTANILKHARDATEQLDYEKFASHDTQMGAIAFCLIEFQANTGSMTPYMKAFHDYVARRANRRNVEKWPLRIVDVLDRRVTLGRLDLTSWRLNLRRAFFKWLLNILTRAKSRLEHGKATR